MCPCSSVNIWEIERLLVNECYSGLGLYEYLDDNEWRNADYSQLQCNYCARLMCSS